MNKDPSYVRCDEGILLVVSLDRASWRPFLIV